MNQTIAIACDHAGYKLKLNVVEFLKSNGYEVKDFGSYTSDPVDYADYGHPLAAAIDAGEYKTGITLCGSGNGINMVTNKHQRVRGALCWNKEIAEMARRHNDANICSLPSRYINEDEAKEIISIFLNTPFDGGRHQSRIEKIPLR
jgi:ribose 5-phosphate isomerase B